MMFEQWMWWAASLALWAVFIAMCLSDGFDHGALEKSWPGRAFQWLGRQFDRAWDASVRVVWLSYRLLKPRRISRGRRRAS